MLLCSARHCSALRDSGLLTGRLDYTRSAGAAIMLETDRFNVAACRNPKVRGKESWAGEGGKRSTHVRLKSVCLALSCFNLALFKTKICC